MDRNGQDYTKKDLERTCGEYVEKMFSGKFGACSMRQVKFLLGGEVEHGTMLVSALARGLRSDRRVPPKKQREMVSRHLETLAILPGLQERLCGAGAVKAEWNWFGHVNDSTSSSPHGQSQNWTPGGGQIRNKIALLFIPSFAIIWK